MSFAGYINNGGNLNMAAFETYLRAVSQVCLISYCYAVECLVGRNYHIRCNIWPLGRLLEIYVLRN